LLKRLHRYESQFLRKKILTVDKEAQFLPLTPAQPHLAPLKKNAQVLKTLQLFNPPLNPTNQSFSLPSPPLPVNARNYSSILDEFSLHYLVIRKGALLLTEEFESYKRTYMQQWTQLEKLIQLAENYFKSQNVRLANLDGRKLA